MQTQNFTQAKWAHTSNDASNNSPNKHQFLCHQHTRLVLNVIRSSLLEYQSSFEMVSAMWNGLIGEGSKATAGPCDNNMMLFSPGRCLYYGKHFAPWLQSWKYHSWHKSSGVAYRLGFVKGGVKQPKWRNPTTGNMNGMLSPQAHMTKANFKMIFRELGNLCLLDWSATKRTSMISRMIWSQPFGSCYGWPWCFPKFPIQISCQHFYQTFLILGPILITAVLARWNSSLGIDFWPWFSFWIETSFTSS